MSNSVLVIILGAIGIPTAIWLMVYGAIDLARTIQREVRALHQREYQQ